MSRLNSLSKVTRFFHRGFFAPFFVRLKLTVCKAVDYFGLSVVLYG
ncbi:hypothetical protein HMPREF9148_02933 [Prevotella sp. F0091]|nr:hypothetical protein HMPREF9148_02933 [Prevotella sp. F0091]